jgi:TPP-dependent pyruvate/acetoin dehydrogenase alpha subunit
MWPNMATAVAERKNGVSTARKNGARARKAAPKAAATAPIERHGLSDERLVELYRTMLRIRRFEEKAKELFLEARLYGSVHLYIGEEAVATGACAALVDGDVISSTHRGHGHCIAKGLEMSRMMAELMGKATGYNHGKGGSMHIASLDHGMLGANGIVGAGIPISTGAALGFWIQGKPNIALCFFGDGAANHGYFHEGINFAATLDLPAIFVCENNQYSQYHSVTQDLPIENVADRSVSYGIPGVIVDGSDVLAIYGAAKEAADRARRGEGPTLIEAKTYRYYNHWGAPGAKPGELGAFGYDPLAITSFRPERELRAWMARDPVDISRSALIGWKVLDRAKADAIEAAANQEMLEAFAWADKQPFCKPEDGLKHVFVEGSVTARQFG